MTRFPEHPVDVDSLIYLEATDKPLPSKLNPRSRYIHFKTIARGGKAIIQSCQDLYLGRTVCYKKLRPELNKDEVETQRFLREARVSAMLQHPNTIPMYELGRDGQGHLYFTMKLVHGYTLRQVLDYRERYDLSQLLDVIGQVAQALAYAHSHHVVHRDIKPENILVGPFGEVLLLDWGLAKVWRQDGEDSKSSHPVISPLSNAKINSLTGQGALQGTVTYMSPEQLRRDPDIDYRSDIFSLGVVLYELLCGRTPEVAETVRDMSQQIQTGEPGKPSTHTRVPVSPYLENIVMQCIEKDPERRIVDCGELVRLLHEAWHPQ
jgi:serine/threonine-protein kinase